jgi:MFS family permease
MAAWLSRGIAFAALMVVVHVVRAALIGQFQTRVAVISVSLLVLLAVAAFVWGLIDGRTDARANSDPDRRDDLATRWLLAGLGAGLLSGVGAWLVSLAYKALYVEGLINQLTTFGAFTALVVFLSAVLGLGIGRWTIDRKAPSDEHAAPQALISE